MADNENGSTGVFREKNIERIESPEKLNDYLRVTSPGVWLVLTTIIVFLTGVVLWMFFGSLDATTVAAVISDEDGRSVCLVPEDAIEGVIKNHTVRLDGIDYALESSFLDPEVIDDSTDVYVKIAGRLSTGDIVYPVVLLEKLDKGVYTGTIVTETMSPVALFF